MQTRPGRALDTPDPSPRAGLRAMQIDSTSNGQVSCLPGLGLSPETLPALCPSPLPPSDPYQTPAALTTHGAGWLWPKCPGTWLVRGPCDVGGGGIFLLL